MGSVSVKPPHADQAASARVASQRSDKRAQARAKAAPTAEPNAQSRARFEKRLLNLHRTAGAAALSIGVVGMVGWIGQHTLLQSAIPGAATMKFNTAACIILCSLSLLLSRGSPRSALGFALTAGSVALATMAEYVFGVNLGVDELLFKDPNSAVYPGRMSVATALAILSQATATVCALARRFAPAHCLSLVSGAVGLLALVGYANGFQSLYDLFMFSSIAVHTAMAVVLMALALLFYAPHEGLMGLFNSDSLGGSTARRLLPFAILAPILLGWLRLEGERAGYYDSTFGAALTTLGSVVVLSLVIYLTARSLHQVDMARRRAQRAEQAAARRLQLANAELRQFAYSVSHDIKGPLSSVLGLARLALEDLEQGNLVETRHALGEIDARAGRLSRLVDDTLELTRADLLAESRARKSVAAIAEEACTQLRRMAEAARVELTVDAEGPHEIQTQPARLSSALHNLVENAIKYRSPLRDRNWVRITIRGAAETGIRIEVADNGLGIPISSQKDVFRLYLRFHPNVAAGTGLGLALVKRQASYLGAAVDFRSDSEGTTFSLTLPPEPKASEKPDQP
ncbi:MAG: hypothetical protein GC160_20900 [Acidobacteria bacterium]|nr:hypothetical protein [Acidobacteriota bacterium]